MNMTTDQIRQLYLDYFKSKAHKVFSSDSLVPADDPSLLFTGAGMNQFKPYFLGLKKDVKRATSCQKCLRTADLERVGKTAYHHTFFEMLGNFSFGDYFKEEAIAFGWEFVTQKLKLPKEKLWVSVFQEDDEAFDIWHKKIGLPKEKIVRMGPEDNFWPANAPKDGPNGPCGPCSEIYVGEVPGKGVEIWNLVFTQFDRQSDGSLLPLPQKNIDTGMGLERATAVLQGVESNFDIDTFKIIRGELKKLLKPGFNERAHENAIMDHIRAVVFCVADGVVPSNIGRGYVIRKLIRAASDHMNKAGALEAGTLNRLVPAVVQVMKSAYPELVSSEKNIRQIIQNEESSYLEVIKTYVPQLKRELAGLKKTDEVEATAFKYRDTYGVPYDNIVECVRQSGFELNPERFNEYLEEQKKKSRESTKISSEIFSKDRTFMLSEGLPPTEFLGYSQLESESKLLRIVKENASVQSLKTGEEALLFFDKTPFYAEAGGQVGDRGVISGASSGVVLDAQGIEKATAHKVKLEKGVLEVGKSYSLKVDADRRSDIMKNHTATHLLHSALRKVLGDHVKQSGSLVAPDRLRFDFTHFSALKPEQIAQIEDMVNEEVRKNTLLDKKVMSKEEAVKKGAIAFFGEKYGEEVRVVSVGDFSKELCGGTHLGSTGEIGSFRIISESSIQAGVRRIEAVTGRGAAKLVKDAQSELEGMSAAFGSKKDVLPSRIRELSQQVDRSRSDLQNIVLNKLRSEAEAKLGKAPQVNSAKLFVWKEKNANAELFQKTFEHLKNLKISFAALWECETSEKVSLVVGCSPNLVAKGFNAGKIVKEVSTVLEGSGGGRPEFAVGGGKNLSKVDEALLVGEKQIRKLLENQ